MVVNRFVVLLRAVNVGGRKLPMAEFRTALSEQGYGDVTSYIQSGNLVLSSPDDAATVAQGIENLIEARYGYRAEAIARSAADFVATAAANPFGDADPKRLHLCLTGQPPLPDAADRLADRGRHGERIALAGGAIWIDFAGGVGDSRLTPAMLDKAAGSVLTARNWNTVLRLVEMASDPRGIR